ncbi:uncharacterized protein LOC134241614 [Saccostrea cucullata]|uniref:uncharacterized protein LOC134241614 n=1 Tax=Saccostrea cuccullata TaxID=36930 RepID=UPI002ED55695
MKKNVNMGTGNEVLIRISNIIMFLTSIPCVCKCNSCPATTRTIKKVDSCPTTEQEWIAASNLKKCYNLADYKTCGKSLVYHCLLNEWWNETIEVCAPPWFMSGFCPMFNTAEQRVIDNFNIDCSKFTNGSCPIRYLSSEAYKYQMCYKKIITTKTFQNTIKPDEITLYEVSYSTNKLLIILVVIFGIGSLVLSALLWLAWIGKIGKGGNVNNSSLFNCFE